MVERQERTHEQSINDALGEVLGEMRKSWTVGPERIGALHGSGRADVLVLDETGWPVAIEAKVANGHADAEQSADARLGQKPVGSAQAIESVVAKLDRALLVDVLGLPESLCAEDGPLDTRRRLAAEPQIHGGKKSRVVFTDEGEVSRKKRPRR